MDCSQLTMTLLFYLPMFILSFIVVLVCGLIEWKHISGVLSIVCLYLFPLEGQLLTTNLFKAYLHPYGYSKSKPEFPEANIWHYIFMFCDWS
jgi:hypothetical protein